jgi:hypothetical protein
LGRAAGRRLSTEDLIFPQIASAVLERDCRGIWFVKRFRAYYEDTKTRQCLPLTLAAPPLKTYHAGLGERRQGKRPPSNSTSPLLQPYKLHPKRNTDFDQLYRDRDWLSLQAAFQHQF